MVTPILGLAAVLVLGCASLAAAATKGAFSVSDLPKLINFSPSHTAHYIRLASRTSGPRLLLLNFSVGLRSGVCNSSL